VLLGAGAEVASLKDGELADIAPTLLALLGMPQPKAMTGHSLIVHAEATAGGPGRQARVSA
jgi:2,3-bisphosphoglycerate-independent phosphoglycerate mutase